LKDNFLLTQIITKYVAQLKIMTTQEIKKVIKKGLEKQDLSEQNRTLRTVTVTRKNYTLFVNGGTTETGKSKDLHFEKVVDLCEKTNLEIIVRPKKLTNV
jgi:uncharacterized ubiquitin-like protein YukD